MSGQSTEQRQGILGANGFAEPFFVTHPLRRVDIADARIGAGPFSLPPAAARLRLKEWQHYCLISPEVIVTLAVVDAKLLKLSWIQVVDLATGERIEHHQQSPRGDAAVARTLWDDHTHYRARGYEVKIHSHLDGYEHRVEVRAEARGKLPAIAGSWRLPHDPAHTDSMVVSMPVGDRRCAWTHKVPLPAQGELRVGDRTVRFEAERDTAILDVHKAHYPRRMFWRWATFAGFDARGRRIALNMTQNVAHDAGQWNENVLWIDGKLHRLGDADIPEGESEGATRAVRSRDGRTHLVFSSAGYRGEDVNLAGLMRSHFRQHYGHYEGQVELEGELVEIAGFPGLFEDHLAVW